MMPLLSIITINYNNAAGLKRTIESVAIQTFKNYEYIIIDGGSSDESIDIIKQNSAHINHWISEKDSGIYNAMNKGIVLASGKYVLFINSGDRFANKNALEEAMPLLDEKDIVYGDYLVEAPGDISVKTYPGKLRFSHFFYDSLPHTAGAFIKKNAFRGELLKYDESLKIVADWKWYLLAIFRYNYSYKHLNKTIGIFDYSGISASNPDGVQREKDMVLRTEFGELYNEMMELGSYKSKYETIYNSAYIQFCLKLKKALSWKK